MPTSKARQNANRKWNESNLDRIYLTMKKGQKDIVKQAAQNENESLNSFINHAIEYYIDSKKTDT